MEYKRIPASKIRQAWLDENMTAVQAAASLGTCPQSLQKRAKAMGLPRRVSGPTPKIPRNCPAFKSMWINRVNTLDIGRHYGCSDSIVGHAARRDGLMKRHGGYKTSITLAQHQRALAIEEMAQQARLERKEMVAAGLVDGRADRLEGRVA